MVDTLFGAHIEQNDTDERYTPAWLFEAMGVRFDLDVAHPIGITTAVPCERFYTREDDGLEQDWHGLVWCNPPFSQPARWARRMIDHGNGILLAPMARAAWAMLALAEARSVCLVQQVQFLSFDLKLQPIPFLVGLFAFGDEADAALVRLAVNQPTLGVLMRPERKNP